MPVNLNAFVRYKTIDSCLRNQFISCDINHLIQKCSEAISNKMGEKTSVSERTIRNDIRVLRSDILGFEAPITCRDGIYQYSNSDYSIFNTAIADKELLVDIQNVLVAEYENLKNKKVQHLIISLAGITGVKIPENISLMERIYQKRIGGGIIKRTEAEIFEGDINDYLYSLVVKKNKAQKKRLMDYFKKPKTSSFELFKWEFILEGLSKIS